jgi:hypothetical protein
VLLNNLRPDEDDRFYFLYRFAVRSWLLFLAVLFSVPIAEMFHRSITGKQFIAACASFFLILVVDFISLWIKAYAIYKEQERIDWENHGRRKTR